jgi:hypothetical protein
LAQVTATRIHEEVINRSVTVVVDRQKEGMVVLCAWHHMSGGIVSGEHGVPIATAEQRSPSAVADRERIGQRWEQPRARTGRP